MKALKIFLLAVIGAISIGYFIPSLIRAEPYCLDNRTLIENNSIYLNGSWYNFSQPTFCNAGCDNVTFTCNPPTYIQPFIFMGIILGLFVFFTIAKMITTRF